MTLWALMTSRDTSRVWYWALESESWVLVPGSEKMKMICACSPGIDPSALLLPLLLPSPYIVLSPRHHCPQGAHKLTEGDKNLRSEHPIVKEREQ